MASDLIRRTAVAVRRRQFERTGAGRAFDETVPPTENELDDATTAIFVVACSLSAHPKAFHALMAVLNEDDE